MKFKNKKSNKAGLSDATQWLIILLILLCIFVFAYRKKTYIYTVIANESFGGLVYDLDMSEYFFKKLSKQDPVPMFTNYQLSRINFIRGDQQAAIIYANKEIELYPENCRTKYIRGLAYGYSENLKGAIKDFEDFNVCFPGVWAGHNDLAWLYFRDGQLEKALETLEDSAKLNPENPWIQNGYGVMLLNTKKYAEAKEALTLAKTASDKMNEQDWGKNYPGNNPLIYNQGLSAMRSTIEENLKLVDNYLVKTKQ